MEAILRRESRPLRRAEIELDEMGVGAAGEHLEAAVDQSGGEHVRVRANLLLVLAERVGCGDPEANGLRRDRVHQRPALHSGEECPVDRLRVLLGAEHEPGARARERLVGGRGDEMRMRHRARMQTRRDQPREMSHVGHQQRPHLVRDLAEPVGLDRTRIRRAATHDQLRPHLLGLREHLVVVNGHRLARDAVVVELVQLPGEVRPSGHA